MPTTISTIATDYTPIESTIYVPAQSISNAVQSYVVDVKVAKPGEITFIVEIRDSPAQDTKNTRDTQQKTETVLDRTAWLSGGIKPEPIDPDIPGNSCQDPIATTPAVVLQMSSPVTQDRLLRQGLYPPGLGKVHSYKIRRVSIQSDEKENMYDHPRATKRRKVTV